LSAKIKRISETHSRSIVGLTVFIYIYFLLVRGAAEGGKLWGGNLLCSIVG
jgi:hypothetical protein